MMTKGNVMLKCIALIGTGKQKILEVSPLCFRISSNLDKKVRLNPNYNHPPNLLA